MDGQTFVKVVKDAGLRELWKRCAPTDCDIIFAKVKTKGQRKITFPEFCQAIDEVARKAKCTTESLAECLKGQNATEEEYERDFAGWSSEEEKEEKLDREEEEKLAVKFDRRKILDKISTTKYCR